MSMLDDFKYKDLETMDENRKSYRQAQLKKHSTPHHMIRKYERQTEHQPRSFEHEPTKIENIDVLESHILQLNEKIIKLEKRIAFLHYTLSQINTVKTITGQPNGDSSDRSTLELFCEAANIKTFPKNPVEKLSGLFSEFNIHESSTDIIRDVRNNR